MPRPMNPDRLLTTQETATLIGCSTRTVHRMVQAGTLLPVKRLDAGINGALVFDRDHVQRIAKRRAA